MPETAPRPDEPDPRQIGLFSDYAVLLRELDASLDRGAFEEADGVLARLERGFGPDAAAAYAFIPRLAAGVRSGTLSDALRTWSAAQRDLAPRPALARRVRRAFFRRAAAAWGLGPLAEAAPQSLAEIANAVADDGPGRSAARCEVRNALLRGEALLPVGFEDAAIADVLAEDRSPVWLACLGAVRRVWPVTPPPERDPGPPAGRGQARRFWYWLQIAESTAVSRDRVYDARKHLKRLDPDLHQLYMRHARKPG